MEGIYLLKYGVSVVGFRLFLDNDKVIDFDSSYIKDSELRNFLVGVKSLLPTISLHKKGDLLISADELSGKYKVEELKDSSLAEAFMLKLFSSKNMSTSATSNTDVPPADTPFGEQDTFTNPLNYGGTSDAFDNYDDYEDSEPIPPPEGFTCATVPDNADILYSMSSDDECSDDDCCTYSEDDDDLYYTDGSNTLNPDQLTLLDNYYKTYSKSIFDSCLDSVTLRLSNESYLNWKKTTLSELRGDEKWEYDGFVDTGAHGNAACTLGHPLRYVHYAKSTNGHLIAFGIKCMSDFFQIDARIIRALNKAQRDSVNEREEIYGVMSSDPDGYFLDSFKPLYTLLTSYASSGLATDEQLMFIRFFRRFIGESILPPRSLVNYLSDIFLKFGDLNTASYRNTLKTLGYSDLDARYITHWLGSYGNFKDFKSATYAYKFQGKFSIVFHYFFGIFIRGYYAYNPMSENNYKIGGKSAKSKEAYMYAKNLFNIPSKGTNSEAYIFNYDYSYTINMLVNAVLNSNNLDIEINACIQTLGVPIDSMFKLINNGSKLDLLSDKEVADFLAHLSRLKDLSSSYTPKGITSIKTLLSLSDELTSEYIAFVRGFIERLFILKQSVDANAHKLDDDDAQILSYDDFKSALSKLTSLASDKNLLYRYFAYYIMHDCSLYKNIPRTRVTDFPLQIADTIAGNSNSPDNTRSCSDKQAKYLDSLFNHFKETFV